MRLLRPAMLCAACGCVVRVPPRRPPPPPPVYAQPAPPPPVYQAAPPPPVYTQPAPPPPVHQAYPAPPPSYHQAYPAPPPGVHQAEPAVPISRNRAISIAVNYAASQRFTFSGANADWRDGAWMVHVHGRPPTPGQLRIRVDPRSGAILGVERKGHDD